MEDYLYSQLAYYGRSEVKLTVNDVNLNASFLYNIWKCAFKKADHGISAITQPTSACSSCNVMLKALRAETVEATQCVYTASLTANSGQLLAFIHIYNRKDEIRVNSGQNPG